MITTKFYIIILEDLVLENNCDAKALEVCY
jgi:hypothetical protein